MFFLFLVFLEYLWKTGLKNILIDLDNNINQTIRAAMESIGLLTNDILDCLKIFNVNNNLIVSGGKIISFIVYCNVTEKIYI